MHLIPEISIKLLIIQHINTATLIQHYIDGINSGQRENLLHNL